MKSLRDFINENSAQAAMIRKLKEKQRQGNNVESTFKDLVGSGHGGVLKSNKDIKILHDPKLYAGNLEIEYKGKEYCINMRGEDPWKKKLVIYDLVTGEDIYKDDNWRYREDCLVKNLTERDIIKLCKDNL